MSKPPCLAIVLFLVQGQPFQLVQFYCEDFIPVGMWENWSTPQNLSTFSKHDLLFIKRRGLGLITFGFPKLFIFDD